jgi:hypothetical protein
MSLTSSRSTPLATTRGSGVGWMGVLVGSTALVAAVDLGFLALVGELIPPLVAGAALSVVGVLVVRRAQVAGVVILALTNLLMLIGAAPFAVDHLAHPDSGIDWIHAVVGMGGRIIALVAAVAVWRSVSESSARMVSVVGIGLLGVVTLVGLTATALTSGDDRQPGDVLLDITATEFPERIEVSSGDVLFIDNRHMFRHTFTVEGTDIDVALPALQGVRVAIDLPPGVYEVLCDVPGHEAMTGQLIVR